MALSSSSFVISCGRQRTCGLRVCCCFVSDFAPVPLSGAALGSRPLEGGVAMKRSFVPCSNEQELFWRDLMPMSSTDVPTLVLPLSQTDDGPEPEFPSPPRRCRLRGKTPATEEYTRCGRSLSPIHVAAALTASPPLLAFSDHRDSLMCGVNVYSSVDVGKIPCAGTPLRECCVHAARRQSLGGTTSWSQPFRMPHKSLSCASQCCWDFFMSRLSLPINWVRQCHTQVISFLEVSQFRCLSPVTVALVFSYDHFSFQAEGVSVAIAE